ncbi:hypothetical protein CBF34_07700 [Vagococcus penaei]|uniref:Uncharacterized protein n=1 Tax=Vagococcus penaei TaxID=633807 RepID=A0A1Q2D496_9ENTE|nr:hypothetical protein [Vagococcus penaei]AQP53173.1 hypothetical protein BW732_02285 [Vagococcus penaei]RSU00974.1 hypothetical protein CBF34_07700 [Vagococcus penaei]
MDKEISKSSNPIFSIQNVYATILFKANIGKDFTNVAVIKQSQQSMEILEKCISDSQRKAYHAKKYAEPALEYFKKSTSQDAKIYIDNAREILEEQLKLTSQEQKKIFGI